MPIISLSYKKLPIAQARAVIAEMQARGAIQITMTIHWPKPPKGKRSA